MIEKSSVDNLKEYIEQDTIYQDWKTNKLHSTDISDFDYFCIKHCEDIEKILNV